MSNHKASHECLQQNYIFTANKQLLDHTVIDFVGPATTIFSQLCTEKSSSLLPRFFNSRNKGPRFDKRAKMRANRFLLHAEHHHVLKK